MKPSWTQRTSATGTVSKLVYTKFVSMLQRQPQFARVVHLMRHRKLRSFLPALRSTNANQLSMQHVAGTNICSRTKLFLHPVPASCPHNKLSPCVCGIPNEIFMVATNIHFQNSPTFPWFPPGFNKNKKSVLFYLIYVMLCYPLCTRRNKGVVVVVTRISLTIKCKMSGLVQWNVYLTKSSI